MPLLNTGVDILKVDKLMNQKEVKRANGTLQDRLVKEMRLAGINDQDKYYEIIESH